MGNKHTLSDLYQMQAMPLSVKIRMTKYRIKQWIERYGEDGVYISFSGGKDSTVVVQLAFTMLESLAPEERTKPIYIVSSDTLI